MAEIDPMLFSVPDEQQQRCPLCGGVVGFKRGKHGLFKSCSGYPACTLIEAVGQHDGHIIKTLDLPCPECGQALVLRQGRFGIFIGCAAYPQCQHIEKREQSANASSDIACPACNQGQLQEKKSRYGKLFYACDAYPDCKFALNFKPIKGRCSHCDYPLLMEKKLASGAVVLCANKACQAKQEP